MEDLSNLYIVKMRSGMELIGKVEIKEEGQVFITDTFQISYKISDYLTPTIHLIRFMMTADGDTLEFTGDEILTLAPPRPVFYKYYHQANDIWHTKIAPALDESVSASTNPVDKESLMLRFLETIEFDPSKMQ